MDTAKRITCTSGSKVLPFPRRKKQATRFEDRARQFVRRNIPTFPVTANGKAPLTRNGFKDSTADRDRIKEWARKHPDANVGIPTGERSGLVVIDLDKKGDLNGITAYQTLLDSLGLVAPGTYRVGTPSGGEHVYFRTEYADRIRNSASLLGPGIDVRGEGGYVLGDGSAINGANYRRVSGSLDDVVVLPKALRLKLMEPRQPKRHGNGGGAYKTGTRNNSLLGDAYELRADGHSYEQVLDRVRGLNLSACQPPLKDKEVVGIVESAFKSEGIHSVAEALTDMGNARRLAIANAGKLVYVHELEKWFVRTDGGHWRRQAGKEYALAKQAARQLQKKALTIKERHRQDEVWKFAKKSQSKVSIEACLKLAQSEPEISACLEQFDRDPYLLAVTNGVIDLRTRTFRSANPDDYFLNVCPTAYDPDAKCPNWLSFLKLVQPNRVMRRYLQKLVGLTLVGTAEQEIIIVLHGDGGTGKTTFLKTIMKLLGELAIKFPTAILLTRDRDGSENELLRFRGVRMAVSSELPKKRHFNEAALKDLSSTDPLSAKPLWREAVNFTPSHTLWIYGNDLPRVSGHDTGVWRRMVLMTFEQRIRKKLRTDIRYFDKKLKPELPGILNWALDGCIAWQRTGLRRPRRVSQATKTYRSENDVIKQFVRERVIHRNGGIVRGKELYAAYSAFAIGQGETPVSNTKFGMSDEIMSFDKDDDYKGKKYLDIELVRHGP